MSLEVMEKRENVFHSVSLARCKLGGQENR